MRERLTGLEASFLALERTGLPMHVAAVVVFDASGDEGPLTVDHLRRQVVSRLSRLPRLRRRVHFGSLGLARPEWSEVSRVDIVRHVYQHRLRAPGRQSQLANLCGLIHEGLLPRDRPLWQMHLIDGLEGHRQALVVKTHHAITDGIGGMELAQSLLDRRRFRRHPTHKKVPGHRMAGATASPHGWLQAITGVAFTAASGPFALASPFNSRVSSGRAFAMATLSMDQVRRAKQYLGVSVDDILLAAVAGGLEHYFRRTGRVVPPAMRAMLPASTRPASSKPQPGNHVTAVFIDLPLDSSDLGARARRIAISKDMLRTAHAGLGMSMLIELAGRLPAPLHQAAVRLIGGLPVANLVVSDVPGPEEPQFLLGHRIVACYPMLPLSSTIGLSIAAIRMGGTMGVGVTADPDLLPDPARLASMIEWSVNSLAPVLSETTAPGRARRAA
jgi:WS/DGAT/MGAT family acyltransferase